MRRLALIAQTVRILTPSDLVAVAGGIKVETDTCTATRTEPVPTVGPACPWPPPIRR